MSTKREFWHQYATDLIGALRRVQPLQSPDALGYSWEPYPLERVRELLLPQADKGLKCLDVGAGIGNVVLLAKRMGYRASGIEIRPRSHFAGVLTPDAIAFGTDGMTFDRYGEYDVVYMYQPHPDDAVCERLAARIWSQLRTGGTLLYCGANREPEIRRTTEVTPTHE